MKPKAAQQLPDTLNGIEDRRIGRQIIEAEAGRFLLSPVFVQQGVVVFGIVGDDDNLPSRNAANFLELDQELPEGLGVKVQGLASGEQFAIAQAHGTEVAHTFTGRMMSHNGIFDLRGHPRFAARAVLLKMNLIQSPEIRVRIEAQGLKFFLCSA